MPADTTPAPAGTVGLYEFVHADGRRAYGLAGVVLPAGFVRSAKAIALVWQNPVRVKLPVGDYLGDLVVDAGADQCAVATAGGGADVTLDASRTSALAGTLASVRWHVPGLGPCETIEGATGTVHLPAGMHEVTVDVTDSVGNLGRDAVTIVVQ